MAWERDHLREATGPSMFFKPPSVLIEQLNRHLRGWATYYFLGYPAKAWRSINHFTGERMTRHLRRRSQRTGLQATGGHDVLRRAGTNGPDRPIATHHRNLKPKVKDTKRAGCGKSAARFEEGEGTARSLPALLVNRGNLSGWRPHYSLTCSTGRAGRGAGWRFALADFFCCFATHKAPFGARQLVGPPSASGLFFPKGSKLR